MKKVVMYSKIPCPYCVNAKIFFNQRNIPFEEIDLTHKFDELAQLVTKTGHRTVPQIFIGDKFIGGYSDLMELVQKGEFEDIIK
jgi:glutaredoxin 3